MRIAPLTTLALALAALSTPAARAATISGTVRNEAGQALSNVDIDFIDQCTGDSVFLSNDKTAADGTYSVSVANGTYDVRYTPPVGSTVVASERNDYVVSGNANLGVTTLHPGRLVSGTVRNPSGVGLAGVDLKFVDQATDSRVYISKDVTNAAGQYSVRVPPGTWSIDFRPPATSTLTDAERVGLVVGASDVSGLVDTLGNGFNVNGTIVDRKNNALKNVDIDVYDECTGKRIATAHDNTDATGKFSVYVPAGSYIVNYDPPRCKVVEAARNTGVVVDRTTTMGTTKLKDAVTLGGTVVDELGQPITGVRLKFFDATAAGSPRQAATNDRTDATGAFSVFLPPSTYDIKFEPPAGRNDQVTLLRSVAASASANIGTIQLAAGVPVSAHLVGPSGQPVINVNVNAVDSTTRTAQELAHDDTDAAGAATVVMAEGTFDVQYDPPACTGLAPASQNGRVIAGSTALPTLALVAGVHALGTVYDSHAAPAGNVDLDFYPAGQPVKSYTPRDSTSAAGAYDVTVQPGSYDIKYIPPAGSRLRPAQRLATTLLVNTTLTDTVLADGWLVSGFVKADATLVPLAGVTVEFYPPGGATPLWTNHHVTAIDGSFNVAVDAGIWDVYFAPPAGSGYAPRWRRGVTLGADLALGDTLLAPLTVPVVTTVGPAAGSTAGGQPVTITGSGFQSDATVLFGSVSARSVVVNSTSSLTAITPAHPAGVFDVDVVNPGNQHGVKASAFAFSEPTAPVRLTVTRAGSDVVLAWGTTGQASYTVFRNAQPTGFSDASILATTGSPGYTDGGAAVTPGVAFYEVN